MPIKFACPKCQKPFQVADKMAGKKAKCSCGNPIQIPAASSPTPATANRTAAKVPAQKQAASKAAPGFRMPEKIDVECETCGNRMQVPLAMAGKRGKCPCGSQITVPQPTPIAPEGSYMNAAAFDEFTDTDFGQQAVNPYAAMKVNTEGEAKLLNSFIDHEAEEEEKKKKSLLLIFVSVIHGINALGYLVGGILMLVISNLIPSELRQSIPILSLGPLFFGALFLGFSTFDVLVCVGLLMRKAFGWWLAIISMAVACCSNAAVLTVQVISTSDIFEIIFPIIAGLFSILCPFIIMNGLSDSDVKSQFGLGRKNTVAYLVAFAIGMCAFGGILGTFLANRPAN